MAPPPSTSGTRATLRSAPRARPTCIPSRRARSRRLGRGARRPRLVRHRRAGLRRGRVYPDTVEPPMTGGDAAPVPAPPEPPPTEPPTRSALDNAEESFARRLAGQLPESAEPLRERLLEVDARHAALPPAPDPPPPDARRVRLDSGTGDPASGSAASQLSESPEASSCLDFPRRVESSLGRFIR